jgi:hypothetical protein
MSLILEALKKLDREKAFIRKVTANIADEILKTDPIHPRKRFPLYFTAVLLTVCITAILTYFVIANLGFLAKTPSPAATAPPGASPHAESSSPSQIPVGEVKDPKIVESKTRPETESSPDSKAWAGKQSRPQVASVPHLREPKQEDQGGISVPSSKDEIPVESKGPSGSESSPDPKPRVKKQPAQQVENPPPPRGPDRKVQEGSPPLSSRDRNLAANKQTSPLPVASLRLTGIVWSQDPSARCAVINGAIINEGAVIQGSKVVEILPNRVRLIQDGRPFEIQLF